MKDICCKEMAVETTIYRAPAGGGLYPSQMRPESQVVQSEDGSWNVNGCCGGGCYVLTGIRFCPFCGTKLPS